MGSKWIQKRKFWLGKCKGLDIKSGVGRNRGSLCIVGIKRKGDSHEGGKWLDMIGGGMDIITKPPKRRTVFSVRDVQKSPSASILGICCQM